MSKSKRPSLSPQADFAGPTRHPAAPLTDFDIRYRRLLDDLRDLAQMAIGQGRAGMAAALLDAEKKLVKARDAADARRAGRPN
jgi:hypothetical protein